LLYLAQSSKKDVAQSEEEEQDYKDSDGQLSSTFWQEIGPINCVESQVKKLVLEQFSGVVNEFAFLKLVEVRGQVLQNVVMVLDAWIDPKAMFENLFKASLPDYTKCAGERCKFNVLPPHVLSYHRASDLSLSDPFLG
jgi:hypothetical protein